jgi:hypothetical protein
MQKLLNAYRADPTLKAAQNIRRYERLHAMCRVMLSKADCDLLADAIHHANKGQIEDALRAKFPGLGDRLIVI